jgi:hypothetical protein
VYFSTSVSIFYNNKQQIDVFTRHFIYLLSLEFTSATRGGDEYDVRWEMRPNGVFQQKILTNSVSENEGIKKRTKFYFSAL